MKPYIHRSFWSDSDIEALTPESKLVVLWLITNPQTSNLGMCAATEKRFHFDTGLPVDALQRAIDALPKSLIRVGATIFVRNFIRHQFGAGDSLKRNLFFRTLTQDFHRADPEIQAAIQAEYEEFRDLPKKPLARASKGVKNPEDRKGKEGKDSKEDARAILRSQVSDLYSRRPDTAWSEKETRALAAITAFPTADEWALLVRYYAKERAKGNDGTHRRDIFTFLNNLPGEIDRARGAIKTPKASPASPLTEEAIPDPEWWRDYLTEHPQHAGKHFAQLTKPERDTAQNWGFARNQGDWAAAKSNLQRTAA